MKKLISATIKKRKELIEKQVGAFTQDYIDEFERKLRDYIQLGHQERAQGSNPNTTPSEKTLLKRIEEYEENYFAWVKDFTLPTTNNLSERALRNIKSRMKISGQFQNAQSAEIYATLKTYTEACRRNEINEMEALARLFQGNPITVAEIFGLS